MSNQILFVGMLPPGSMNATTHNNVN